MKLFEITIECMGVEPVTQVHEASSMAEALAITSIAVEAFTYLGIETTAVSVVEVEACPVVECEVILLVA